MFERDTVAYNFLGSSTVSLYEVMHKNGHYYKTKLF